MSVRNSQSPPNTSVVVPAQVTLSDDSSPHRRSDVGGLLGPAGAAAGVVAAPPPTAPPPGAADMLRRVHWGLRGRYPLAIVLGIICGGVMAAVGWRIGRPIYHSEGLVRIAYTMPEVKGETDQNRPLPNYDTFMLTQKMLITSRRVIDQAIQDPVWKQSGRQVPAEPDKWFAKNLKVETKPRSEYMQVLVTDYEPGTAATAVTAIINAYAELYNNQEKSLDRQRIGFLIDRQRELDEKVSGLNQSITELAKRFGGGDLDLFFQLASARVSRLEGALSELTIAITTKLANPAAPLPLAPASPSVGAAQPAAAGATAAAAPAATQPAEMSDEQIGFLDPVMRTYLDHESGLQAEVRKLERKYGESNRSVADAKAALEDARQRTQEYAAMYRKYHPAVAQPGPAGQQPSAAALATKSLEELKETEAALRGLYEKEKKSLMEVGAARFDLKQRQDQLQQSRDELEQLNRRIESLRAEGSLGGRLSIVSTGESPLSPDKDPRLLGAASGLVVGGCMPAAVMVLLSMLIKRTYRYSDETEAEVVRNRAPVLGILPSLEQEPPDEEEMWAAAHSLHQIRVTLRARQGLSQGSRVYLMTSASSGEGKTSLSMSLGLSFAASRLRTLVVDADLVGRHLTTALRGRELDGLHEALSAGTLRGSVRKVWNGLSVLTAGKVASSDACTLSSGAMKALLGEARKHFDVILLDAGPILGSLEAAVLAQEADGVVFTIARGQQRGMVDKALQRLDSLGARLEGVIFNRAEPEDFLRSPYGSTSRSSSGMRPERASMSQIQCFATFGPLVRAVAAGMPAAIGN
jgi:polysaccharide biosynthesis transport protein